MVICLLFFLLDEVFEKTTLAGRITRGKGRHKGALFVHLRCPLLALPLILFFSPPSQPLSTALCPPSRSTLCLFRFQTLAKGVGGCCSSTVEYLANLSGLIWSWSKSQEEEEEREKGDDDSTLLMLISQHTRTVVVVPISLSALRMPLSM